MSVQAVAAGIDTWSPAWYLAAGSDEAIAMGALATVRSSRGFLLPDKVSEHRVGWNPGVGLLYAEGHPREDGLAAPDTLVERHESLVAALLDAGVPVPPGRASYNNGAQAAGDAGLRRVDSAVDLAFSSGAEGIAVLAGVAALLNTRSRHKADIVYAADGRAVETVYLRSRSYVGRWYDKGIESHASPRGTWIRPEDQRRYTKETRREVSEFTTSYVKTKFQQRFQTLWKASKGVKVAGAVVLAEQIAALVEAGEITPALGKRLAGHLVLRQVGLSASRSTEWRLDSACTELGLVLADGVMQEVEVDLQDVLEEVMETPMWGASG